MRRTSLSQTVPHSEDNLGDEEDNLRDGGGQVYHKQYHTRKTI